MLLGFTVLLSIALYQYFKRNPGRAVRFLKALAVLLFAERLLKQIYRVAVGIENPALMALPWHMCTLLTFLMPVVVFFGLKKWKDWIYPLCMMGGIVTLLLGGYFKTSFLKFEDYEGIWAHMLLILIPIVEMAIGEFGLRFKNIWKTHIGLVLCTLWGLFADLIVFPKYHTNSSELMSNELGFDIPGIPYPVVASIIAILFIFTLYSVPALYRKLAVLWEKNSGYRKKSKGAASNTKE